MKIRKVENNFLRAKIADGFVSGESFVVSVLTDGSGILIEFDDEKYLLETSEIVKEIIKRRSKCQRCLGTGKLDGYANGYDGGVTETVDCPKCKGTG